MVGRRGFVSPPYFFLFSSINFERASIESLIVNRIHELRELSRCCVLDPGKKFVSLLFEKRGGFISNKKSIRVKKKKKNTYLNIYGNK